MSKPNIVFLSGEKNPLGAADNDRRYTVIEIRPICAVRGIVRRGRMCMAVGSGSNASGDKECHHKGKCEHQHHG